MALLARLAFYGGSLLMAGFAAIVLLRIATGRLSLDGLLYTKDADGQRSFSPRACSSHVVSLIGNLYYAKKGGKESSNCQLTEPADIDYHIGIGFDPALADKLATRTKLTSGEHTQVNQSSIIVEMTPHWRAQFKPAWNLDALTPVVGRQVRVVGQLLVDNEHYDPHDDCAFPGAGASCWRASVWELHPVTRFQVCASGTCTETSGGWTDLEDLPTTLALISHGAPPAPAAASTSGGVAPGP